MQKNRSRLRCALHATHAHAYGMPNATPVQMHSIKWSFLNSSQGAAAVKPVSTSACLPLNAIHYTRTFHNSVDHGMVIMCRDDVSCAMATNPPYGSSCYNALQWLWPHAQLCCSWAASTSTHTVTALPLSMRSTLYSEPTHMAAHCGCYVCNQLVLHCNRPCCVRTW
jgi:hypothetical protein